MPRELNARAGRRLAVCVLLAAAPLAGALAASKNGDPFEKLNRATYAFNNALDRMIAHPAARAFVKVVPAPARKAFSNFIANLNYSQVIVNDALQGKLRDAGSDVVRLLLNTTIGIGGLGDPATRLGFPSHDEDFGQTLGHWGVPPGPYLVIPILGPSDLRDGPAKLLDTYTTPPHYVHSSDVKYALYGATLLDRRVSLLSTDTTLRNAYDPYVFVRNAYIARRAYLVHDGNVPEDNFDDPTGTLTPTVPSVPAIATADAGGATTLEPPTKASEVSEPAEAVVAPGGSDTELGDARVDLAGADASGAAAPAMHELD